MYKTLKELLARDANGRLTLLNPLEPINAEPTNRGTRAIATSVDKLLAANTAGHSFRIQSLSSSVSWDNPTSTLTVAGELYLECAFPTSGDETEVFPYTILLSGNYSVPAYRVLILPEVPAAFTLINASSNLLNFSSITELIEGITSLSGDEQARAILIAAKNTTSVWVAPGTVIADGATITNFGTDSQYAIQNDFLTLENYVQERDHLILYDGNDKNLVAYNNIGPAGTITIRNFDDYYVRGVLKSNKTLNIAISDVTTISPGEILYVTYPNMEDGETETVTAVTGTFADAGSAEKYIVLMAPGNDIALPVSGGQLIFGSKTRLPFTVCGRLEPTPLNYETSTVAIVRSGNYGGHTPPASPHTTSSFPRLVKSGGSAQSAYTDTGVEAHKVVCGDLTVYGTPKSGETGGTFPYPPTGSNYKVVTVSTADGTGTAGIETTSIFVDGRIWADEIALGSTPTGTTGRIGVRGSIVLQAEAITDIQIAAAALESRMDTAESDINSVEADVTALQTDMTTAQGDIEAVETLLPIVEFTAEFARNLAHEARYFGSAMDIKYDGEVDFSYDNLPLSPVFRRPRPYLSVRVGTPIATLTAGAVRGLSSDGYRLFILDLYDDTNYRLRSVRLDVSSAPNWENTLTEETTVPALNDERPFLECSGHDVYLMSVIDKVATRYNKALVRQEFDLASRASLPITGNNTVICNRYYLAWYDNSSNNIAVLRLGNTLPLPTRIHNPEVFTSSAITATTVNVGSTGRVLSVCSFGKICGLLIQTAAGASVVQARVDDNGSINIGSPLLAYDGTPTAYAASCTDGEFFFFGTGLDTDDDNSIHLAITTISREDGTPNFKIVFGDELTHTNYPGLFYIQQILADGNTLYIVCRAAVYAFKYNGNPTNISFCWSYPIASGEAYCAALTWAGLIIGLKGFDDASSTQNTVIWLRTDTYGKELIEFEELELPSQDWLYRKPFRQLRTFMS